MLYDPKHCIIQSQSVSDTHFQESSINLFVFAAGRKAKPVVEPIGGICDSCGKFERDLKRHMETEHSEAKKCHHCSFEISDQNKLNLHYLVSR